MYFNGILPKCPITSLLLDIVSISIFVLFDAKWGIFLEIRSGTILFLMYTPEVLGI